MGAASLIGRDVRLERNASPFFAPRASLGHQQRDPLSGIWYMYLGFAEICWGRLEAAIEQLKHAIDSGYPTYITYSMLAGAEAAKGNDAEAKSALAEARRLFPRTHNQMASDRDADPIDRYRWLAQDAGRMSAHLFFH